MTQKYLAIKF